MQRYQEIDCWIFDLDNTLYSPKYSLFPQIDQRMGEYICDHLNLDRQAARQLQKQYYREYGTTMRGLMQNHGVKPLHFTDFVHDIDYSLLPLNPALKQALRQLKGRKFIHTNATSAHSMKVMKRLGIDEEFEAIFDIENSDFIPKPHESPYHSLIKQYGIDPSKSVMVEDLPQNLEVPAKLGMKTILVFSDDHDRLEAKEPPSYIDHVIDDLTVFLTALNNTKTINY